MNTFFLEVNTSAVLNGANPIVIEVLVGGAVVNSFSLTGGVESNSVFVDFTGASPSSLSLRFATGSGNFGDTVTFNSSSINDSSLDVLIDFSLQILLAGQSSTVTASAGIYGHTVPTLGSTTITGTAGDDVVLFGTSAADVIDGLGGNDRIRGLDNDDAINGGGGHDTIYGEDGADTILGGAGNDLIFGHADDDTLFGEGDDDTINGGAGNDILNGGAGDDYLLGEAGDDVLFGEGDNDHLIGGAGDDILFGDDGDDYLFGGADHDALSGGLGADHISGGAGNDIISGGAGDDDIFAGDGDDQIEGGADDDLIWGGDGVDTIDAGAGADTVILMSGEFAAGESLVGGTGTDILWLYGTMSVDVTTGTVSEFETLTGNDDDQTLTISGTTFNQFTSVDFGLGTDTLNLDSTSTALNAISDVNLSGLEAINASIAAASVTIDVSAQTEGFDITGSGNADIITGGAGADDIVGGAGDDTINLANGAFAVGESIDGGAHTTADTLVLTNATTVDFTTGTLSNLETLTGSSSGDDVTIDGSTLNQFTTIDFGSGSDTLNLTSTSTGFNALGNANLLGLEFIDASTAAGAVTIDVSAQTEDITITGSASGDQITMGGGADIVVAGVGNDTISTGDGDDTIFGGDDDDIITGGAGADFLFGDGNIIDTSTIGSYDPSQDGGGTVTQLGNGVNLNGNNWKSILVNYTVTANTVLEFDIRVNTQNEIHGIGFDNDTSQGNSQSQIFQIYGTQSFGANETFRTYSGSGEFEHYSIDVGTHFTGTFSHLTLISDDDNAPLDGDADWINIVLYESDGAGGSGGDDTFNLANGDFVSGESIIGGGGTDDIVFTNATTVDFTVGQVSSVEVLTGSSGNDDVTIDGSTLNQFTSINFGGGTTDTLNLTSTSTGLNALSNANLSGLEFIDASTAAGAVTIDVSAQTEAFDITGSASGDTITGGTGADTIDGGAGDDTINLANGAFAAGESIDGGAHATADTLILTNATTVDFTTGTLSNLETFTGSSGNDDVTIDGTTLNQFTSINFGGGAADTLNLNSTSTGLNGLNNASLTNLENIDASSAGSAVTIDIGAQTEGISVTGSSSADTIVSGLGNDTITGGGGNDTVSYEATASGVTVDLSDGTAQNTGGGGTDTLSSIENLTGSDFDDDLTGDGSANVINGGTGDDVIDGGGGADTIYSSDNSAQTDVADILAANSGVTYNASTGNFYQHITTNAQWNTANTTANGTTLNGVNGHLAVVSSQEENDYLTTISSGQRLWIGGNDATTEGEWYWTAGPESGTQFWTGGASGSAVGGLYSNWVAGDPSNGSGAWDYIEHRADGTWWSNAQTASFDYIIEWEGDAVLGTSGTNTIDGGAGNDDLYGTDAVQDIFDFNSGGGIDDIYNFVAADEDALDISDLLTGYTAGTSDINDFIRFTNSGANTTVEVDTNGGANSFSQIASIIGVNNLDADALLYNGSIIA